MVDSIRMQWILAEGLEVQDIEVLKIVCVLLLKLVDTHVIFPHGLVDSSYRSTYPSCWGYF